MSSNSLKISSSLVFLSWKYFSIYLLHLLNKLVTWSENKQPKKIIILVLDFKIKKIMGIMIEKEIIVKRMPKTMIISLWFSKLLI